MYYRYYTKQFQKALNKIISSGKIKRREIENVVDLLSKGNKLPSEYRDHKLHGEYIEYRECHIRGDIVMIYKIEEDKLILLLLNIGSHSELFK